MSMNDNQFLTDRLQEARELSWKHFGRRITFHLPGMFVLDGITGKYPAISLTGGDCALKCDHCAGAVLNGMIQLKEPWQLVAECQTMAKQGHHGVLISGGCDEEGRLPWERFIPAIEEIRASTNLLISVHSGLVDDADAFGLKQAGVDQALIDVIGSDETFKKICHAPFGISRIQAAMESLDRAKIPIIPHIVCGIDYGRIRGEKNAVAMISRFKVEQVVIVSLMSVTGAPMERVSPPSAEAVADIIAEVRFKMPQTPVSLGCARQRGNSRLEVMAIDAGVSRLALPSDEAVERAAAYGLDIRYQKTCCSVSLDLSGPCWDGKINSPV